MATDCKVVVVRCSRQVYSPSIEHIFSATLQEKDDHCSVPIRHNKEECFPGIKPYFASDGVDQPSGILQTHGLVKNAFKKNEECF